MKQSYQRARHSHNCASSSIDCPDQGTALPSQRAQDAGHWWYSTAAHVSIHVNTRQQIYSPSDDSEEAPA